MNQEAKPTESRGEIGYLANWLLYAKSRRNIFLRISIVKRFNDLIL